MTRPLPPSVYGPVIDLQIPFDRTFARERTDLAVELAAWVMTDASGDTRLHLWRGLSADAGVDYTDQVAFARTFPSLAKRGLRAPYQMIGYSGLPADVFWGYWLKHVHDVRFKRWPPAGVRAAVQPRAR